MYEHITMTNIYIIIFKKQIYLYYFFIFVKKA